MNKLFIATISTIAFSGQAFAYPETTARDVQSGVSGKSSATWQQYMYAARDARNDKEKSAEYSYTAIRILNRALKKDPQLAIAPIEQSRAKIMCIHTMCAEGSKIIDGPDGSKITNAAELEKLVAAQAEDYQSMQNAHQLLSKISPDQAKSLAWELTKCSSHMATTKANLEKLAKN